MKLQSILCLRMSGRDSNKMEKLIHMTWLHSPRCGVVGKGGLKVYIHPPTIYTKPSGEEVSSVFWTLFGFEDSDQIDCLDCVADLDYRLFIPRLSWSLITSKVAPLTSEYYEMLEAVYSSEFYTNDPGLELDWKQTDLIIWGSWYNIWNRQTNLPHIMRLMM